jgi:hypothetical protein
MKKIKKRGRPKGSSGEPTNLEFWKGILKDNQVQQFLDRGSKEQKELIKNVLQYLKNIEPRFFERVNGKLFLKQLKRRIK